MNDQLPGIVASLLIGGVAAAPLVVNLSNLLKWALSMVGLLKDGQSKYIVYTVAVALVITAATAQVFDLESIVGEQITWLNGLVIAFASVIGALKGRSLLELPMLQPKWKR